jgi:hypothetical protein
MKTKLLENCIICIRFFTNTQQTLKMQVKRKQKFLDQRGKPSLIVFNEKSSYKESDSQSIQRAIRSKDNSSFTKTKSKKTN